MVEFIPLSIEKCWNENQWVVVYCGYTERPYENFCMIEPTHTKVELRFDYVDGKYICTVTKELR